MFLADPSVEETLPLKYPVLFVNSQSKSFNISQPLFFASLLVDPYLFFLSS